MASKSVSSVVKSPPTHWVGDGFPVASIISPSRADIEVSPFLMLDYGGPHRFEPATRPRGVDSHPHRGFETVTLVFQGEVEHRDSAGNSGSIGPGDVQWMTAASGVLHEEKHSKAFTRSGGAFEVAQFWVNLPARAKMEPPRYQSLVNSQIAEERIEGGSVRVIAGEFGAGGKAVPGAAQTVTPLFLWDITLQADATVTLPVRDGHTLAVFVREGEISADGKVVDRRSMAIFSRAGRDAQVTATRASTLLVFGGEPINEPIASYGPFVMNTAEEIKEAIDDFRSGRFGTLAPT